MRNDMSGFTERVRRLTALLGVAQVLVGCLIGFIPPTAVPWFRGVVMAHIEYTGNGVLLIVLAMLLPVLRLGPAAVRIWFVSLQLGTWLNGSAGLVAGLLGRSSSLLTVANASSPPPGGATSSFVTDMLMLTGVSIVVGLGITLVGLVRGPAIVSSGVHGSAAVTGSV